MPYIYIILKSTRIPFLACLNDFLCFRVYRHLKQKIFDLLDIAPNNKNILC